MKSFAAFAILLVFVIENARAQRPLTVFEQSGGKASATYNECIQFYRQVVKLSPVLHMQEMGQTDAGIPLHLVICSNDRRFDPGKWDRSNKLVVLVNNGIHPGEPDGIDASMMLVRDIAVGKYHLPDNIILAVIPVYNIGGALNRSGTSRVNQDGPELYGFRGNAQNLDLNRDFTKADSREAKSFTEIFHYLHPDILIDNHVSDGADYQHTMTLLSTQYDKLGGATGAFLRNILDQDLYKAMSRAGQPMIPYVNVEDQTPDKGWHAFYDPPRFSSGYAALFGCIAYVPETHMLKPFRQRTEATYTLMQQLIAVSSQKAREIKAARSLDSSALMNRKRFALHWSADTTKPTLWPFNGYEAAYKSSAVTGQQRLYYDHNKPFEKMVPVYDRYIEDRFADAPAAYVIQQGWHDVTDRLKWNKVQMVQLAHDTLMTLHAYHIDDYKTINRPYEKHYRHYDTKVSSYVTKVLLHKGDYIIPVQQPAKRFLVEMLEPTGDDSYFAWNFFDGILQQKEGYSDYRWEDVAERFIQQHPEVMQQLKDNKQADTTLAKDADAQLQFVYRHSPYYEPVHLRYPVFRIEP
jgi:hypothetical protein